MPGQTLFKSNPYLKYHFHQKCAFLWGKKRKLGKKPSLINHLDYKPCYEPTKKEKEEKLPA